MYMHSLFGIRPAQFSGIAYPATAKECSAMMNNACLAVLEERMYSNHTLEGFLPTGALIPHIDFRVNIACYAQGYVRLRHFPKPDLVIILATAHYGADDVIMPTYKCFQTPLGVATTDVNFLDALYEAMPTLTRNDSAHTPEHSIEFEVLWLQHLWGSDVTIVPLLIAGASMEEVLPPTRYGRLGRAVQALQGIVERYKNQGKNVFVLVSGDLSHVGKRFGDAQTAHAMAQSVWQYEENLLHALEDCSDDAYYDILRHNRDAYRICGAVPTLMMLSILAPQRAVQVYHDRWDDADTDTSVGFATMLFSS